ncbi:MAG: DUF423 domain-containing protein [Opitutales bacterium]
MSYRTTLLLIGLFGFTGVALGAFGAHALHETLVQRGLQHAWETAVTYQLLHTVALLGLALGTKNDPPPQTGVLRWAARLWAVGILLFSGSLYGLALGGPAVLGPVTPLGGLALLGGWGCVIAAGLKQGPRPAA